MLDAFRTTDDPGLRPAPLRHPERLAPCIHGTRRARRHTPREVREGIVLLLMTIGVGWLGGQIIAAVMLNESVLAALGIVP
jgi:hypothetical protein